MTLFAVLLLTMVAGVLAQAWFSKPRMSLGNTGDFFMLAWGYYGFSVAIDMLLGLEIREFEGLPALTDPEMGPYVIAGLAYYLSCGGGFLLAYILTQPSAAGAAAQGERPVRGGENSAPAVSFVEHWSASPPPLWLMAALHGAVFLMFDGSYFSVGRGERLSLNEGGLSLTTFAVLAVQSANLVYLIISPDRVRCAVVMLLGISLGVVTGDRSDALIYVVCFLLKFRVTVNRAQFIAAVSAGILVLAFWKVAYYRTVDYALSGNVNFELNRASVATGFSGLDGRSSFLIFATTLQQECPYLLGQTYTVLTALLALPMAVRGYPLATLAQSWALVHAPEKAEQGWGAGYSALAEAWINFGPIGPLLLGLAWGVLCKRFDTSRRGIAFFVFALITCRLFRSDFGSLAKQWIVLHGTAAVSVYIAWSFLFGPQRTRSAPATTSRAPAAVETSFRAADQALAPARAAQQRGASAGRTSSVRALSAGTAQHPQRRIA